MTLFGSGSWPYKPKQPASYCLSWELPCLPSLSHAESCREYRPRQRVLHGVLRVRLQGCPYRARMQADRDPGVFQVGITKLLNGLCFHAGQPAITSFIPPSVDSIILDYQSPNAQAGFYPNEDPNSGGVGARPSPCMLLPSSSHV